MEKKCLFYAKSCILEMCENQKTRQFTPLPKLTYPPNKSELETEINSINNNNCLYLSINCILRIRCVPSGSMYMCNLSEF